MKLNIGCGEFGIPGFLNADSCWGEGGGGDEKVKTFMEACWDLDEGNKGLDFVVMDCNDLSRFPDETFDEIFSNQCVGEYVTNYDEIARVLKKDGVVKFGVWGNVASRVMLELLRRDFALEVRALNGITRRVYEPEVECLKEVTFMIVGRRTSNAFWNEL